MSRPRVRGWLLLGLTTCANVGCFRNQVLVATR